MKKFITVLIFSILTTSAHAATVTWTGGGDGTFSDGDNWDTLSAPSAGDDLVFDGTGTADASWDVTTDFNTINIQSGYTGTLTGNATMNVTNTTGTLTFDGGGTFNLNGQTLNVKSFDASGNSTKTLTMGASVVICSGDFNLSGSSLTFNRDTSEVQITGTSTVTLGMSTELYRFTIMGSGNTLTLGSNITVNDTFNYNADSGDTTVSPNTIYILKDAINSASSGNTSGTAVFEFSGSSSQSWSPDASGGSLANNVTVNKSGGTLTLVGTIQHSGNYTFSSGTVSAGTSTYKRTGTGNVDPGGQDFNNFEVASGTTTLTGNLGVQGTITVNSSTTLSGSSTVNTYGNFTGDGTVNLTGTTTVGSGNIGGNTAWSFGNLEVRASANSTKTGSGSITVPGNFTVNASSSMTAGSSTWYFGGNFSSSQSGSSFAADTSTAVFNANDDDNTISIGSGSFYNLTFNGSGGVWTNAAGLTVTNTFTITNGVFSLSGNLLTANGATFSNTNSGTLRLQGGETINGLTMDTDSGTVEYVGTGTYSELKAGDAYYHLLLNGSSGAWTLDNDLDINGNLTIQNSGTLNASSRTITVTGDFTSSSGTFNEDTSTVVFDGNSTVTVGSGYDFNYLTIMGSGNTITLGSNIRVNNDFNYNGDSGNTTINSNTIYIFDYAVNSASSGNTSGTTVFEFSGSSSHGWGPDDSGGSLANNVIVNKSGGVLFFLGTIQHSGNYTHTTGSINSEMGNSLYKRTGTGSVNPGSENFYDFETSSGTTTLTGNLVARTITVGSGTTLNGSVDVTAGLSASGSFTGDGTVNFSGGTTTLSNGPIGTFNFGGATAWTFSNLTISTHTTKTGSGSITVNGNLSSASVSLDMGSATWYIGGNWNFGPNNGSFESGTSTVVFTATDNDNTITHAPSLGDGFYNLTFNGSGGVWTLGASLTVSNALTITAGTLSLDGDALTATGATFSNSNSGTLRLQGGETITGLTMDTDSGTVEYVGNGTYSELAAGDAYYHLLLNASAGAWTLDADLDVNGNLKVNQLGTLNGDNHTIHVAGNFDFSAGNFDKGTSTVIFDGTSIVTGTATILDFYNLTLASGSTVHLTSGDTFNVDASGTFTATSCTLDATSTPTRANLNVLGAQSVSAVTATDIDSSGGNEVNNVGGTNTNTVNWAGGASSSQIILITGGD